MLLETKLNEKSFYSLSNHNSTLKKSSEKKSLNSKVCCLFERAMIVYKVKHSTDKQEHTKQVIVFQRQYTVQANVSQ